MNDRLPLLIDELKRLRKGRGTQAAAINDQLGPVLRELCDIDTGDGPEAAREKLVSTLTGLIKDLPGDLKRALETAFALTPEARQPFLTERIAVLAAQERRDDRTILRRGELGMRRLAEIALKPQPAPRPAPRQGFAQHDWYLQRFDALLRMDGVTPVCHEVRTIVATTDGVDRITWSISLPKSCHDGTGDLDVEVLRGVELADRRRVSAHRLALDLELPAPLHAGQTHEFALQVGIPRGQAMRPTYVFWPERRCEQFNLVVRFGTRAVPQLVWQVREAFHRDADDNEPGGNLLTVDNVGETRVAFEELRTDRGYGVQWRP